MQILHILRGLPGSGKSTFAAALARRFFFEERDSAIVSRDELRMDMISDFKDNDVEWCKGYHFSLKILREDFHYDSTGYPDNETLYQLSFKSDAFNSFINAKFIATINDLLVENCQNVIIDATNLSDSDLKHYKDLARTYNALITIYNLESDYGSVHGVPNHILDRMKEVKKNNDMLALSIADNVKIVK